MLSDQYILLGGGSWRSPDHPSPLPQIDATYWHHFIMNVMPYVNRRRQGAFDNNVLKGTNGLKCFRFDVDISVKEVEENYFERAY